MPVRYRINPALRFLSILLTLLIIALCVYFLFFQVQRDSSWVFKFLPLVVLFVSLDQLFRYLTTLYSVVFTPDKVILGFVLRRKIVLEYQQLVSMKLSKAITYYVWLEYMDEKGKQRQLKVQASFPRMLEVMYNLADLAPQIKLNDELDKMISVLRKIRSRLDSNHDED